MGQDAIVQISDLLARAGELRETLSNGERLQLMGLTGAFLGELERPDEAVFRMPSHFLAIKLGIKWGVFDALGDVGSEPKTSSELAAPSGASPRLVARFLRHLAANGTLREVDTDKYASTRLSSSLRQDSFKNAIGFMFDDFLTTGHRVPSFLDTISHRNPTDITNGPFQHANAMPNKSLYTYFSENTSMAARFGSMVQMYNAGKPFFWEDNFYPLQTRLLANGPQHDSDVLLVDIGGGDAGDLARLRAALPPGTPGRLILQELAHIVARGDHEGNGYEAMVYDWNEPQPVVGARAYMLHHILHDFASDDACRVILGNVVAAMRKGYSKLLVKDLMVPDRGAPWPVTAMDVNVMQSLSGQERTERQLRELLASVGLRVEAVWRHERALDVVVEAVLE